MDEDNNNNTGGMTIFLHTIMSLQTKNAKRIVDTDW